MNPKEIARFGMLIAIFLLATIPNIAHSSQVLPNLCNYTYYNSTNATAINSLNAGANEITNNSYQSTLGNITVGEQNVTITLSDSILGGHFNSIIAVLLNHGYAAMFLLMALEQSSLPIPSEVVASLAGYLASKCFYDFALSFLALTLGGLTGIAIDYYIGFYLGREFIYRHLGLFHLKKEHLESFEAWFQRNGSFAVFVTRLLPVVRTVMSFPAGFAKMQKVKFFGYSLLGLVIWNGSLMVFGYYLVSTENFGLISIAAAIVLIILYVGYKRVMKNAQKGQKKGR